MSEVPEQEIWYPNKNFVLQVHSEMLKEFGGYPGFERGIGLFDVVLEEAKNIEGLYKKAAVLLRRLIEVRIFCDGNHRTACEVTDVFLRMNGEKIKITEKQKIIRFIKEIKQYNIDEIEAWLKDGKVPERSY